MTGRVRSMYKLLAPSLPQMLLFLFIPREESEERHTEEWGDGVQPTLAVTNTGVADLYVRLLHHEALGQLLLEVGLPHRLCQARPLAIRQPRVVSGLELLKVKSLQLSWSGGSNSHLTLSYCLLSITVEAAPLIPGNFTLDLIAEILYSADTGALGVDVVRNWNILQIVLVVLLA